MPQDNTDLCRVRTGVPAPYQHRVDWSPDSLGTQLEELIDLLVHRVLIRS